MGERLNVQGGEPMKKDIIDFFIIVIGVFLVGLSFNLSGIRAFTFGIGASMVAFRILLNKGGI